MSSSQDRRTKADEGIPGEPDSCVSPNTTPASSSQRLPSVYFLASCIFCHNEYLYTEMTWILLTWIAYNYRYDILFCVGDTFLTTYGHLFCIFNTMLTLTFREVDF